MMNAYTLLAHNTPLLLQFIEIGTAVLDESYALFARTLWCGHADTHLSTNYPRRMKTHNANESTT